MSTQLLRCRALNESGPSDMAWALKWAGPKKTWAFIGGLILMGLNKFFSFFFFFYLGPTKNTNTLKPDSTKWAWVMSFGLLK